MENKRVVLKRRSVHELQFVPADSPQVFFDLFPLPIFPVNHHTNLWRYAGQLKFVGLAHLDGPIREPLIVRGFEEVRAAATCRFESTPGSSCRLPAVGKIRKTQCHILGAPLRNVEEDHGRIDERVLGIQLRRKRASLIPISCINNLDRSRALNAPCLLVRFFDKCFLGAGKRFHLLHVTAEVADLVERIPRGHPDNHLVRHIGNGHCHVEEVPLGMIQEDGVLNGCPGGRAEGQDKENAKASRDQQPAPGRSKGHRVFASPASCPAAPSFFRTFSHRPSKLPLDMMSRRSPGLASAPRYSAMTSELGNTWASLPSARTLSATVSGSRRFSPPNCWARKTPPRMMRSPRASDFGNAS